MSLASVDTLNTYLADKSYIEGFTPSQADVSVFEAHAAAPNAAKHPHAARWFSHIASFANKSALPGTKKACSEYSSKAAVAAPVEVDENEIDLFASSDEEESAEAEKLKADRVAEYHKKKAGKPLTIAKSMVILDVKPWVDDTDMKAVEAAVRSIIKDGLLWGTAKLVAIGYGIKKLQITCVIEDDKISTEELGEEICENDENVQSVDIALFNKL